MCQAYEAEANVMRWMEHRQRVRESREEGRRDAKAGKPRRKSYLDESTYPPWKEIGDAYREGYAEGGQLELPGIL